MVIKISREMETNAEHWCDMCWERGIVREAKYDGKTRMGPWAYMCESCFQRYGTGLGLGHGKRLVKKSL